ncbi:site-2 protease family protein [candidate division WWE3 bacterium]|nr:site-2 protease family protein [candidate division WWE3 bacterium]
MLINQLFQNPLLFIVLTAALIFALALHEFAHAYMAYLQGDPTAKQQGRLTLNPLAHLDPIGTLLLLFAGFGWAKPVPINPYNMKDPKKGSALVSIAGPGINLALAFASAGLLRLLLSLSVPIGGFLHAFLYFFGYYNVILAVFNALPISPLDGFKFVRGVLPENLAQQWLQLAPYGTFILIFLVLTDALDRILFPAVEMFFGIFGL